MDERTIRRAETALDLGAAGAFGLAAAWSAAQLAVAPLFASAAGVLAYAVAFAALRQVQPAPQALAIPRFEAVPLDVPAELILTDEERVSPDAHELLLDDILPPADPGSRVVRLFDVSAMPTPGELKTHIDRHLAASQSAPPDASQALFEALAQLRSSLR